MTKQYQTIPLHYRSLAVLAAVILLLGLVPAQSVAAASPTFSIVSVDQDNTVTIQTSAFPADELFTVRMGAYGTKAVGGIEVATTNSGAGGAFQATYSIPESLKGLDRIAIRLDSSDTSVYGWFQNRTGSGYYYDGSYYHACYGCGYHHPIPTISIVDVVEDEKVTIRTANFPADKDFTVRMGYYGSLGIGGFEVATTNSGSGGSFEVTYDIPDQLKGDQRIAIRLESGRPGYFAYNWFWNNTVGDSTDGTDSDGSGGIPGYYGIPTFKISSVVRDDTVTIQTHNLPPDLDFTVRMGYYGSLGIGGPVVDTINSGDGGSQSLTFTIPDELKGSRQIAIRMESGSPGFFAYNWFWNNTAY